MPKKGGEHTPIILKSARNTEIFILLALLQMLLQLILLSTDLLTGKGGHQESQVYIGPGSFCSSFPFSNHKMSGETKAAHPAKTWRGQHHVFLRVTETKNPSLWRDRKDDSPLVKSSEAELSVAKELQGM